MEQIYEIQQDTKAEERRQSVEKPPGAITPSGRNSNRIFVKWSHVKIPANLKKNQHFRLHRYVTSQNQTVVTQSTFQNHQQFQGFSIDFHYDRRKWPGGHSYEAAKIRLKDVKNYPIE